MLFEAQGISKTFGVVRALSNVSVDIERGEVHAIIGENGAGKSTLMGVICGKIPPDTGRLFRDGRECAFASPRDAQAAGIAIAPQEINLVPALTVAENIVLGAHQVGGLGAIDWRATHAVAVRHLHEIDDTIDPAMPAGQLSKAEQQLVQIARAAATNANILIFDEPTAALTSRETEKLFRFMRRFSAAGNSIFYISHRLDEILALSQRITVLRDGAFITQLDPRTTSKDEMVRHMAGRPVLPAAHRPLTAIAEEVVLRVEGLGRNHEFRDISFDLHKGEVLGIAGLVGSGRTELGKCLFGVTRSDAGSVEIFGERGMISHPADAIARGLVYLPEERKQEGIFALLSIRENMGIAVLDRFRSLLGINFAQMVGEVQDYVLRLKIKIGSQDDPITSLSGGNQQKVIIGRWLMKRSRILILDEPTRGIDVNAKGEIQAVLHTLAREGLSIIYISSELQEVIDVSDRILVMHEGVGKGIVPAAGTKQEDLLAIAME
ncbi:sugar ABC transporter ATP-binding protein [Mesorhizobium sp. CN2-181]|uniref:sugar ABC transporter ATP-binding protein n=1 Tax=Mesorhizobium yinganensis TaxID=3157707 RepID=UPI0032B872A5